jgi:carbon-monoxide dehydrogenase medium subunit
MTGSLAFERYSAPATKDELFGLLEREGARARVFAGGTDVFVAMKEKGLRADCLVDVKGVPELRGITLLEGGGLSIGAATTLHEIEDSPAVATACPVLCDAVGEIGSLQVRNRGTLGGNLANASPAADSTPALMVSNATLELLSSTGARSVPIEAFFTGPGRSVLGPGEIVTRIKIPGADPTRQAVYLKFGTRQAMDIALVGVAVSLSFDGGGRCHEARIALASVAPVPLRAHKAEAMLIGELSEQRIADVAVQASEEARPIDDVRGSAAYRKELVRVLTGQALREAVAQYRVTLAGGQEGKPW